MKDWSQKQGRYLKVLKIVPNDQVYVFQIMPWNFVVEGVEQSDRLKKLASNCSYKRP